SGGRAPNTWSSDTTPSAACSGAPSPPAWTPVAPMGGSSPHSSFRSGSSSAFLPNAPTSPWVTDTLRARRCAGSVGQRRPPSDGRASTVLDTGRVPAWRGSVRVHAGHHDRLGILGVRAAHPPPPRIAHAAAV